MDVRIEPLRLPHDALRATLQRATRAAGRTGEAARQVALLAEGHFRREERLLLPLLALLPGLARGEGAARLAGAPLLAEALRQHVDEMVDEHRRLAGALRALAAAAGDEGHDDFVAFAEDMIVHAHLEEQVLYPAAILAGEYVAVMTR